MKPLVLACCSKMVKNRSPIDPRSRHDRPRAPQDAPRPPTWGQLGAQEGAQDPSQGGQKEVNKGSYVEVALGPPIGPPNGPQVDPKLTPKRNPNKPPTHVTWTVKIWIFKVLPYCFCTFCGPFPVLSERMPMLPPCSCNDLVMSHCWARLRWATLG